RARGGSSPSAWPAGRWTRSAPSSGSRSRASARSCSRSARSWSACWSVIEDRSSALLVGATPAEARDEVGDVRGRLEAELGVEQRSIAFELTQRFRLVPFGEEHADQGRVRGLSKR